MAQMSSSGGIGLAAISDTVDTYPKDFMLKEFICLHHTDHPDQFCAWKTPDN